MLLRRSACSKLIVYRTKKALNKVLIVSRVQSREFNHLDEMLRKFSMKEVQDLNYSQSEVGDASFDSSLANCSLI